MAYNIRKNGEGVERHSSENIEIIPKTDKPGIDIKIKPGTKAEKVHIPVIITKEGVNYKVYNDFYIGEGADVEIVAGCGTAGQAGKRIAHTLSVVEIPAFFLSPADSIHGGMGAMQQGDILVLISKSGNTQEILNYLPAAQKKGLTVIGVTENEESKLGKAADIVLKIKIDREPDEWGIVSSASTLCFISAFDAIAFTAMEETGYTKEEFYLIHTGGGVGEILKKEL